MAEKICIYDIGAKPEGTPCWHELAIHEDVELVEFEPVNPTPGQLPYFLGDGQEHTFYKTRYFGCSSLLEPDAELINQFLGIQCGQPGGNYTVIDREKVKTTRLNDIPELLIPDLVKVDTQGSGLLILENGMDYLGQALVLEIEVEFVPLYKGQPLFSDVDQFLRRHGFSLHRLSDISGRCFSPFLLTGNPFKGVSQFHFADAIFVRNLTSLGELSDNELIKLAKIMHYCYKSYDLTAHIYQEYDRRHSTDWANQYHQTLPAFPDKFLTVRDH